MVAYELHSAPLTVTEIFCSFLGPIKTINNECEKLRNYNKSVTTDACLRVRQFISNLRCHSEDPFSYVELDHYVSRIVGHI